jgi:hypothetical protein
VYIVARVVTNLPDRQMTPHFYAHRMLIEGMFEDLKKHEFDMECTMLRHFLRLSRLTLAGALLYVWLIPAGTQTVYEGLRHLVDRKDRRSEYFSIWVAVHRKMPNDIGHKLRSARTCQERRNKFQR